MSQLTKFEQDWVEVTPQSAGEYDAVDDGVYICKIDDIMYSETDKSGKVTDPAFIYIFCVSDGAFAGARIRKFNMIKSRSNLAFLKGDMLKMGCEIPHHPDFILKSLKRAVGATVEVTVKTRTYAGRSYKDCFIERLVSASETDVNELDYVF